MKTNLETARKALESRTDRSAWNKGVTVYALELLENLQEYAEGGYLAADQLESRQGIISAALNGADDWDRYSWGGSALIYDGDIAGRLCTPYELKRTRNGELRPNSREQWIDTQARALRQAAARLVLAVLAARKEA